MPTPTLHISTQPSGPESGQQDHLRRRRLIQALRAWWSQETDDWDALVEGSGADEAATSDLWDSMPTVDSKAVARTSPIFEEHLGRPLDVQCIRPGGYQSVEDMIRHLVPAMMDAPQPGKGIRRVKQEVDS